MQKQDVQIRCGSGSPVVAHILQEGAADGAGHISGHFSLVQSWRRPPAALGVESAAPDDSQDDVLDGPDLPDADAEVQTQCPDTLRRRREVGAHAASAQ